MTIHNFIRGNAIAAKELRPYEKDEDYMNSDEDTKISPDPVVNICQNNKNKGCHI